jgi:hypothetical protein
MSGLGGGGGGDSGPEETCETLVIDTQLSSPKPKVVALIKVGDVLEVGTQTTGTTTTVIVKHNGAVAGGLAAPLIQRLRQCIDEGTQYRAKVTAKKDGLVRVRVSAITL